MWGASSLIKSIQRGTVSFANVSSGTATIAAVDTANSIVTFGGSGNTNSASAWSYELPFVELTNATTVTATRNATTEAATMYSTYEVIEFLPGVIKSLQRGLLTVNGAGTNTATVTAVQTAKASLTLLGICGDSGTFYGYFQPYGSLASATAVTFLTVYTGGSKAYKVSWHLVEWF
jgi:hypothetical protein